MFKDQEILSADVKEDREFIEALDPARDRSSVEQMYDNRRFFAASRIQKRILDVLGSRFIHWFTLLVSRT